MNLSALGDVYWEIISPCLPIKTLKVLLLSSVVIYDSAVIHDGVHYYIIV